MSSRRSGSRNSGGSSSDDDDPDMPDFNDFLNFAHAELFSNGPSDFQLHLLQQFVEHYVNDIGGININPGNTNTPNSNPNIAHVDLSNIHEFNLDDAVETLLQSHNISGSMNSPTFNGKTMLQMAIEGNNFSCVRRLVENGAKVNKTGEYFETPLHLALTHLAWV